MARPPKPEQLAALEHIRRCVLAHGEEAGPRIAKADFARVSKSTWSRWVAQVRLEDATVAEQSMPPAHVAPLAPPITVEPMQSAHVVELGVIDFIGQVGSMLAAVEAVRDYAWPADPTTGRRKVRNPSMLINATRLHVAVMEMAARRDEAMWSNEFVRAQMEDFQTHIIAALKDQDSAAARRVIEAIRGVGAQYSSRARYLGSPDAISKLVEAA